MAETLPGWGSHCFIQGKDHSSRSVCQRTGKGLQRFMPSLPDSRNGLKTLVLHLQDSLYREGPKCQHLNLWGSDGCWAVWVASVVTITAATITTGSVWMLKCCLTLKKKQPINKTKKLKPPQFVCSASCCCGVLLALCVIPLPEAIFMLDLPQENKISFRRHRLQQALQHIPFCLSNRWMLLQHHPLFLWKISPWCHCHWR